MHYGGEESVNVSTPGVRIPYLRTVTPVRRKSFILHIEATKISSTSSLNRNVNILCFVGYFKLEALHLILLHSLVRQRTPRRYNVNDLGRGTCQNIAASKGDDKNEKNKPDATQHHNVVGVCDVWYRTLVTPTNGRNYFQRMPSSALESPSAPLRSAPPPRGRSPAGSRRASSPASSRGSGTLIWCSLEGRSV